MDLQTHRLDNGITLASVHLPGFRSAALGAFIRVGSRHEPAEHNGLTHFLEHMAFKGTQTRSAWQLAQEVEQVGAAMNAYTAKDHTSYHMVFLGEHLPMAADVLADVIRAPSLPPAEIELERRVIVQEQNEAADDPDSLAAEALDRKAYPNQAMGRPILGTARVVRTLTRADLLSYQHRHYGACNLTMVGVGAIDHANFAQAITHRLASLPAGTASVAPNAHYQGGFRHIEAEYEQTTVALAWPTPGRNHPHYPAYELLGDLLGAGMSSPLFQAVREQRGLAYQIEAWTEGYADCGLLHIRAGLAPRNLATFFAVLADQLHALSAQIPAHECARAQHQYAMQWARSLERPLDLAEMLARDLMLDGQIIPPDQQLARVMALTPDALQAALRALLDQTPTLVLVGPAGRGDHYAQLRRRLS